MQSHSRALGGAAPLPTEHRRPHSPPNSSCPPTFTYRATSMDNRFVSSAQPGIKGLSSNHLGHEIAGDRSHLRAVMLIELRRKYIRDCGLRTCTALLEVAGRHLHVPRARRRPRACDRRRGQAGPTLLFLGNCLSDFLISISQVLVRSGARSGHLLVRFRLPNDHTNHRRARSRGSGAARRRPHRLVGMREAIGLSLV